MKRFALYRAPLLAAAAVAMGACDRSQDPLGPTADVEAPGAAGIDAAKGKGGQGGVRIAFSIWDGTSTTYTVGLDGSGYRAVPNTVGAGDPAWSPDRKKLALTSTGADSGLYVISASGSGKKRLYGRQAWAASWSPDGSRIAFMARSSTGNLSVMTIQAGGQDLRVLSPADGNSYSAPTWSPDGSRIAYLRYNSYGSEIWYMNADGTSPTLVVDCATLAAHCTSPVWSPVPGDQRIAFSVRDGDASAIATINADGTGWHNVIYGTQYATYDLRPSWSPDGTQFVFMSPINGQGDLYLVNADGTNLRQLTDTPAVESFPAWSR
jgi:Tol biopolymer transport system component